jgi:hypothetical protein
MYAYCFCYLEIAFLHIFRNKPAYVSEEAKGLETGPSRLGLAGELSPQ